MDLKKYSGYELRQLAEYIKGLISRCVYEEMLPHYENRLDQVEKEINNRRHSK